MESPSVECLCSLLQESVDQEEFSRIFMLAALEAFIAPNCHGVASRTYYQAVLDFISNPDHDWCSFTLNCLILHIKRFIMQKSQGVITDIGGCKLVPMIAYFEFLITSDLNMGVSIPRLPLWSTHIVNSYITLDSFNGSEKKKFGRLPRKHISSTVFRGISQPTGFNMPTQIQEYLNQKYHGINYNEQDKQNLEALSRSYYQQIVHSSIPIMKRYIDDMFSLQHQKSTGDFNHFDTKKSHSINLMDWIDVGTITKELFRIDRMDNHIDHLTSHNILAELVEQEASSCIVNEPNWSLDLPSIPSNLEEKLFPQIMDYIPFQPETSLPFRQFLANTLKEFSAEEKKIRMTEFTMSMQNEKYYMPSTASTFYDQIVKANEGQFNTPSQSHYENLHGNIFPLIKLRSQASAYTHVTTGQVNAAPCEYNEAEADVIIYPTSNASKGSLWGLSLNERLLGRRIANSISEQNKSEYPSFELLESDSNNLERAFEEVANKSKCFDLATADLDDPILNQVLDNLALQFDHEQKLQNSSEPSSFVNAKKLLSTQVIFAKDLEHDFYMTLTKSTTEYSPRIFKINNIWIDQRTLTLSMRSGGWLHPHVMDAFGMLMLTDMYYRDYEGRSSKNDIVKHIVIKDVTKILMDPMLNHSDPVYSGLFSEKSVSMRLEKAGLVHIACNSDKQWILITANFIDGFFDVLNPDPCSEKFENIIKTVTYNFKILFLKDYPRCPYFNIQDFKVRYVKVPKHNFRYDSGIFVIQFMLSYNGIEVSQFPNDDIQALHEIFVTRLVISRHNEQQVPLKTFYLSMHLIYCGKLIQTFQAHHANLIPDRRFHQRKHEGVEDRMFHQRKHEGVQDRRFYQMNHESKKSYFCSNTMFRFRSA